MGDWIFYLLPALRQAAYQSCQDSAAYADLARQADRSFQRLWKTLSGEQKKLYLRFEADSNARSAMEEAQLVGQVFRMLRELGR